MIGLIMPALLMAQAFQSVEEMRAAGERQIVKWEELFNEGKFDEAAGMMTDEAHYLNHTTGKEEQMPNRAFVDWIQHCRPGSIFNMETTPMNDGIAGRMFSMYCPQHQPKRKSAAASEVEISFSLSSKGGGIRI